MPIGDDLPRLFTTREASKLFGVGPESILRWIGQGQLQGIRTPGGHYRVSEEAIMNVLSTSTSRQTALTRIAAELTSDHLAPALETTGLDPATFTCAFDTSPLTLTPEGDPR